MRRRVEKGWVDGNGNYDGDDDGTSGREVERRDCSMVNILLCT